MALQLIMKAMTSNRDTDLRRGLHDRWRAIYAQVHGRIHDASAERMNEVRDDVERSELSATEAIEFALMEMKTETLHHIDEALLRLDAGEYGSCFECRGEISEHRLRALAFAVRCMACEARRERDRKRTNALARHAVSSRFAGALSY